MAVVLYSSCCCCGSDDDSVVVLVLVVFIKGLLIIKKLLDNGDDDDDVDVIPRLSSGQPTKNEQIWFVSSDTDVAAVVDVDTATDDTFHSKHPGIEEARNRTASGWSFGSDHNGMLLLLLLSPTHSPSNITQSGCSYVNEMIMKWTAKQL